MAEDLISPEQGESQGETHSEPHSEAAPPRKRVVLETESPKRFRGRFWIVYVILGLGVAGAIAGGVIIATDNSSSSQHSSAQGNPVTFTPKHGSDRSVAHQIATQVTSEYSSLGDSVHVLSVDPLQLHPPITAYEPRWDFGQLNQPRHSNIDLTNDSWMYELCGAASGCGIANTGPESGVKFGRRLFRGMLELSLYTFLHIPRIQSVIVLLPPTGQQGTSSYALLVKRASVAPLLRQPLAKAIGTPKSPRKLDSRFKSHLYQWSQGTIEQLPDMSLVLLLNKVETSGLFGG